MDIHFAGRERPINHDVPQSADPNSMGRIESFLFRMVVEVPAKLAGLAMPRSVAINADVPVVASGPDFAADAEFIERELFVPEDRKL